MFEDAPHILICSPTVVPAAFVAKINETFATWAFGPKYYSIRHSTDKMVDAWNEIHGQTWTLTQEETAEYNVNMMGLMWEVELYDMIDNHFPEK